MSAKTVEVIDLETGEPIHLDIDDIDPELLRRIHLKPVGGFCFEAESFIEQEIDSVPFYVEGWLPQQGRLEIYGQDKAGKSTLALQLARCLGVGEPFLGIKTSKAKVLYVQFELALKTLQLRMRTSGKAYPNVYVGTSFSMKLDDRGGQAQLQYALEEIRPDVFILDPLYKIIEGDENEAHDMRVILDFLDRMLETYKCSVVVIHHSGKDIDKGGRGSSILSGWHDSVIEMRKTRGAGEGQYIKLTPKFLRHAEVPPEGISAVMKDFEFEALGDVTPEGLVLARLLKLQKPMGAEEFSDLGSKSTVYRALGILEKDGLVAKTGRLYEVTKHCLDTIL